MRRVLQIYRDGHMRTPLTIELAAGEQGNKQTLGAMKQIVLEDRTQPDLRNFVLREIIRDVRGHDAWGEVEAIHRFCRDEITYRKDPFGVERVADLWSTLYAMPSGKPEGDCGIKSTVFATCCALLGHKPFFTVIKQRADQTAFNHVYNAVAVDEQLRYFDTTPEEAPPGWEAPSFKKFIVSIFD